MAFQEMDGEQNHLQDRPPKAALVFLTCALVLRKEQCFISHSHVSE